MRQLTEVEGELDKLDGLLSRDDVRSDRDVIQEKIADLRWGTFK